MSEELLLVSILASGIRLATPFLIASIGEIFSERSGVLNLGLEGIMLMGAFSGFTIAFVTENLWLGILFGMIVGGLFNLINCLLSVKLGTDQTVNGLVIWILGLGLSSFFFRMIFGWMITGSRPNFPTITGLKPIYIPILSDIPLVGPTLFSQNILVYLALFMVPLSAFILNRTRYGLSIRAVGENPAAADTLGIRVQRTRFLCVFFGGMLAGLAGAYVSLAQVGFFRDNMVGGRGFIVIAIVIFGNWGHYGALLGSLLFGLADSLQLHLQTVFGWWIPWQFFSMLPYIVTIVALVGILRKTRAPAALLKHFKRGER